MSFSVSHFGLLAVYKADKTHYNIFVIENGVPICYCLLTNTNKKQFDCIFQEGNDCFKCPLWNWQVRDCSSR